MKITAHTILIQNLHPSKICMSRVVNGVRKDYAIFLPLRHAIKVIKLDY